MDKMFGLGHETASAESWLNIRAIGMGDYARVRGQRAIADRVPFTTLGA